MIFLLYTIFRFSNFLRDMQLRKRDKIKKNIDVVINKDKNIIWNIDFTDDSEYYAKTPETLYESIEFYINKYEEYIKNKSPGSASEANPIGVKQLKKLAKKIIKVKKIKLGEIAQKVNNFFLKKPPFSKTLRNFFR